MAVISIIVGVLETNNLSLEIYIYIYIYIYILWECWSSVNHYVVMCGTKCNKIWRVVNIYDRAIIIIMIINKYIYRYIYMQISLNIIDILCLHIFFWIRSNSRITFIVFIKIINKNFRFSKQYILETCNQHLIELIFKPVLMYLNVFSYWHYLQNYI